MKLSQKSLLEVEQFQDRRKLIKMENNSYIFIVHTSIGTITFYRECKGEFTEATLIIDFIESFDH